jgi:hypothetical protein
VKLSLRLLVLLTINIQYVFSGTTSSAVNITVTVPASCTLSFNVPNLTFNLLRSYAGSASTTLTIGCTEGANVTLGITSQNNWQLLGSNYAGNLAYTITYPGSGQISGATVQQQWSGGAANRVVLTGTATAADWVIPLNVTSAVVTSSDKADNYTDKITLTLSY